MAYRETGKWENAIDVANRVLASNSSEKKIFRDKKPVYNQNISVSISRTYSSLFLMIFSAHVFLLMAIECFMNSGQCLTFEFLCNRSAECSINSTSRNTASRYGPKPLHRIQAKPTPVSRFGGVITSFGWGEFPHSAFFATYLC